MVTATLEDLRTKESKLKERERALAEQWQQAPDSPEGAKRRASLRRELDEVSAELASIWPQVAATKEQAKKDRLDSLLASPEYRAAVLGSLEGLVTALGPWVGLVEMSVEARRNALAVPLPPGTVSVLYNESKEWLNVLLRRRIIAAKDIPAGLRRLIKEG